MKESTYKTALALAWIITASLAAPAAAQSPAPKPASALPPGFRGYEIGMALDRVKEVLKKDSLLSYAGDADVSLLPLDKGELIDVRGNSFITRASFQFKDGSLWAMTFTLDRSLVDHYSVFKTMTGKYGNPGKIDPAESVWDDGRIRVSIERPLTLKYIDVAAFENLKGKSGVEKAYKEIFRDDFLGEL
jgi:hypothetical protein